MFERVLPTRQNLCFELVRLRPEVVFRAGSRQSQEVLVIVELTKLPPDKDQLFNCIDRLFEITQTRLTQLR
jgi:hypothetical protein